MVKHDPKSFQAGLSVGVSLRGWATAGTGSAVIDSVSIKTQTLSHKVPPIILVSNTIVAGNITGAVILRHTVQPIIPVSGFEEVS